MNLLNSIFNIISKLKIICIGWICVQIFSLNLQAQIYFGQPWNPSDPDLIRVINNSSCNEMCGNEIIGSSYYYAHNSTMTPSGNLYAFNGSLLSIDTLTGLPTIEYDLPADITAHNGVVAVSDNVFYTTIAEQGYGDTLISIDINTGILAYIGLLEYPVTGDMAYFNNEIYYKSWRINGDFERGFAKFNPGDPLNGEWVLTVPLNNFLGLAITASKFCNTILCSDGFNELVYLNLIDGVISYPCQNIPSITTITSMQEYSTPVICNYIDLDCDDSSGADEADYNSEDYNCFSNGSGVADDDVKLYYEALINQMVISISGSIPDGPSEYLELIGSASNLDVSGDGSSMITLNNNGNAISSDFIDALLQIKYQNGAGNPTPGIRTIEVQFTTEAGSASNVAIAFIEVVAHPAIEVDLGPDVQICYGQSTTLNAGNPGSMFVWSTGQTSQTINVNSSEEYIVTVSNNTHCPNYDTINVEVWPILNVSLTGDQSICDNQPADLVINSNNQFAVDIEIMSEPGGLFSFNNVTGNFNFIDYPIEQTIYTIISVSTLEEACIEILDSLQGVDVYPTFIHSFDANICNGDSIWLGFYWETEAGVYENTLETLDGCDSVVTTTVNVLPAINLSIQSNTCDSSEAGVFVEYLNNPNGCDTVITTTVSLLPSDTTSLTQSSCRQADVGNLTQMLSNQQGCDSIVITNVTWSPPADTTFISQTSCDSSQLGITQEFFAAIDGCDSLVITSVAYASVDTTYSFATSCDISQIGTTQQLYTDQQGCDSLVITTVTAAIPDTTYAFATSCDSSSLGVIEMHFVNQSGCDSVTFTTVTYSASDSTFLQNTSCDPSETGIFVNAFINQFGCDSIVTTTITLLPSNEIFIQTTTCDENQSGVFTDSLTNVYGCDSIVITSIELLPSDQTFLSGTTCRSSDEGVFMDNLINQFGCDSIVTLTVSLIAADTTVLTNKTCIQEEVGSIETTYTNQNGCDSLVIEQTILYDLPQLQFTTSDYNGYGISCMGETDGSIALMVNGTSPFAYIWSTDDTTQSLTGLSAGAYAVTVTDANGCNTSTEIILFEPEPFSVGFEITHPDCFDANAGSITVQQTGGIEPVRYSIDGINYQSSSVFENLTGGMYEITAIDANECETKEILLINVPLMVSVNLGEDMQFFPGDTAVINAIVNVPYDSLASVQWNGLNNTNCSTCLTQTVTPIITTTYTVSVTTHDGCADEDALTLFVENDNDVYVPNVFSPDGDGVNDELIISTGNGIERIQSFIIFDRWGNVLYEKTNAQPSEIRWDGRFKNHAMNPGVYAYRLIVQFTDDNQEIAHGDITVIR